MKTLEKLFKIDSQGRLREWTMHIDRDSFYAVKGLVGMKLTKDKPTICTAKNIGRSNQTSAVDQATLEARAKWQKKLKEGYAKTEKDAHIISYFDPMLAQSYKDISNLKKIQSSWESSTKIYSQPKLDGIRCIIRNEDGELVARTRNGRVLDSIPHILSSLKMYFEDDDGLVLDGELYNHQFKDDFNKIVSLVRKQRPIRSEKDNMKSWEKKLKKFSTALKESEKYVQYWIYDIPRSSLFRRKNLFSERFFAIDIFPSEYIKIVDTHLVNNQLELDAKYGKYLEEGFEGQMVRFNSGYEQGKRSKTLLKRKEFKDQEYEVIGIEEGNGNRTGTAKHLVCHCSETDKQFNSNIKGNFDYLADILNNKEDYIGKMATIKYFDLTPDGVPRFPYAIGFRDYE